MKDIEQFTEMTHVIAQSAFQERCHHVKHCHITLHFPQTSHSMTKLVCQQDKNTYNKSILLNICTIINTY